MELDTLVYGVIRRNASNVYTSDLAPVRMEEGRIYFIYGYMMSDIW